MKLENQGFNWKNNYKSLIFDGFQKTEKVGKNDEKRPPQWN